MKTSRPCQAMATRPNRINACCKRFAERESLTLPPNIRHRFRPHGPGINRRSMASLQIYRFVGGIAVDALVFEFMGLAMLALCLVVLAVPARRPRGPRVSDY